MIEVITDINEMRNVCRKKRSEAAVIGLVPTMGAFHEGHLSLVQLALGQADFIVVSIFVNPTQFGPHEDYNKYPRVLEDDVGKLESLGVHAVFAPYCSAMYPAGYSTTVNVEKLTAGLCGRSRPHHFGGVATVVTKLFTIIMPDIAVFGQKDAQQLAVIKRMVKDLNMDIEIVAGPIIREPDGLAMSSRNSYLSPEEREQAPVIYRALCTGKKQVASGVSRSQEIAGKVRDVLHEAPLAKIEYVEIVDRDDMTPVDNVSGCELLAVAVWFGTTRLIDNVILVG